MADTENTENIEQIADNTVEDAVQHRFSIRDGNLIVSTKDSGIIPPGSRDNKLPTSITCGRVSTPLVDSNRINTDDFILNNQPVTDISHVIDDSSSEHVVSSYALNQIRLKVKNDLSTIQNQLNNKQITPIISDVITPPYFSTDSNWMKTNIEFSNGQGVFQNNETLEYPRQAVLKLNPKVFFTPGMYFIVIDVDRLDSGEIQLIGTDNSIIRSITVSGEYFNQIYVEDASNYVLLLTINNVRHNDRVIIDRIYIYHVQDRAIQYFNYLGQLFTAGDESGLASMNWTTERLAEFRDLMRGDLTAITDSISVHLLTHESETNPHHTTALDVDAAPTNHTHTPNECGAAPVQHTHTPEECSAAHIVHTHLPNECGAAATAHTHLPEECGAAPIVHTHTPGECDAAPLVHTHTAAEVGAALAVHTHNYDECNAAPVVHSHTPDQCGAAPETHTHNPNECGAAPIQHTHNYDECNASPVIHTHTPAQCGSAPIEHTHLPEECGAAPVVHTHNFDECNASPIVHTHTPDQCGSAPTVHTHLPAECGAAPVEHTHIPDDCGAAPVAHTHIPSDCGAAPTVHLHSPEQCGAAPVVHTHLPSECGAAPVVHTHEPEECNSAPVVHTHTPDQCGAAPIVHTHSLDSLGAAAVVHTHSPVECGAAPTVHTHTAEDVGAAPVDHTHTLEDLGAAPVNHTHIPEDIGAASAIHTHSLEDLGAAAVVHTHEPDECGAAPVEHTHNLEDLGAAHAIHTHSPEECGSAPAIHTHDPEDCGAAPIVHNHDLETLENFNIITEHFENNSNPHDVTKSQIGLSRIKNYSIASVDDFLAGDNQKYATAGGVNKYLDKLFSDDPTLKYVSLAPKKILAQEVELFPDSEDNFSLLLNPNSKYEIYITSKSANINCLKMSLDAKLISSKEESSESDESNESGETVSSSSTTQNLPFIINNYSNSWMLATTIDGNNQISWRYENTDCFHLTPKNVGNNLLRGRLSIDTSKFNVIGDFQTWLAFYDDNSASESEYEYHSTSIYPLRFHGTIDEEYENVNVESYILNINHDNTRNDIVDRHSLIIDITVYEFVAVGNEANVIDSTPMLVRQKILGRTVPYGWHQENGGTLEKSKYTELVDYLERDSLYISHEEYNERVEANGYCPYFWMDENTIGLPTMLSSDPGSINIIKTHMKFVG